ncbi:MAG: Sortase-like acyltransferase [Frankiales bacterium]|nr:Sortase-like acyltransferase [Frankiales bacterium]
MSDGTELGPQHAPALRRFFDDLPDEDVTYVKESVRDAAVVNGLAEGDGRARRWVALSDEGEVQGYVAVLPGVGLSQHVGELRLVVSRACRGQGIGRRLAQAAVLAALKDGLSKLVVEVPAEEEGTAQVFRRLGFEGEALLRDHIRDRSGTLRDVLLLAHFADATSSSLSVIGADEPH